MIDSHFHLWRRGAAKQTGILASAYLQRDFLWQEYEAASAGLDIERSINVQVNDDVDPLPEADFVSAVGAAQPRLGAIVAWAELEHPGVASQLEALALRPLVTAVRRGSQFEPDPMFCGSPGFVAGARLLTRYGYLCELCVKAHQLEGVVSLAEQCPEVPIVLDHLGKPDLRDPDHSAWKAAMSRLGALANVHCKVSVVVHSEDDPPLTRSQYEPLVAHTIEAFGWDRVLFASNWPVSLATVGYAAWVETVLAMVSGARSDEIDRLMAGNASRLYLH